MRASPDGAAFGLCLPNQGQFRIHDPLTGALLNSFEGDYFSWNRPADAECAGSPDAVIVGTRASQGLEPAYQTGHLFIIRPSDRELLASFDAEVGTAVLDVSASSDGASYAYWRKDGVVVVAGNPLVAPRPGDLDGDRDIDLDDFRLFAECMGGPDAPNSGCDPGVFEQADLDDDPDADVADFGRFELVFGRP